MNTPNPSLPSPLLTEGLGEVSTICALATATGGAIGIIRISGPQMFDILSRVFSKNISDAQPNTIHYGHIKDGTDIIDEVLVSIFRAPHSYTGENCAEISCHGSSYILNKVLALLIENGCQQAGPGEFTLRAYLNGKMDLSQAEAVADLIASNNMATHHIAMSQLRGHFSSKLAQLREQLLKLTSLLELELDFSDHEDLEFADRKELQELTYTIDNHITHLADTFQTGNALKNGIPVAIVGAPNVGKSTLLNALLGEERAIVSDIQGTTRDAIEDTIQLGGVTFRFIDTAGIRHTDDKIESLGIERSKDAAQRARIILLMTEPGVPYPDIVTRDDQTVIHIENKTDTFQAKFGIGLESLKQQLIAAAPKTSETDVIITNARHYDALVRAHEAIQRVIDGLEMQISGDLLSEDLRQALDSLAEITGGQITPNEVLGNIFKNFCVGK
ncbi:tRNA uridine-5-carboxymethylaminomethyl(34) synthesis GTPase MnmE [Prevotella sp. E9-3]|uniref:tRNA uridine-5-carboxymethylaminomethyl(34) synthesis GTPase MnmE n=1 Tax=Prevotella sp. E9-3 TaxID=2913621 RepID=UPI001ED9DB39|nr:tRNA uridine-5-carboxymethylaminomethyl(34) synthesis GTPase MnmE [Prevotella sp. E9-3]UKK47069.1 tRNA uridine-5-carboxymethylaminomethyl(34) synthesis GTPase MnmE [Prevotella sp. E9-3]